MFHSVVVVLVLNCFLFLELAKNFKPGPQRQKHMYKGVIAIRFKSTKKTHLVVFLIIKVTCYCVTLSKGSYLT